MNAHMTVGGRIRLVRQSCDMTQRELGKRAGIAEPTIRRYEIGSLNPKYETLLKIAKVLNCNVQFLLDGSVAVNVADGVMEKLCDELARWCAEGNRDERQPSSYVSMLNEPAAGRKFRDIFVCSMADLFGKWVPFDWIRDIFDACAAAPQHRYLFLTKNPFRYWELNQLALLPRDDNFWYGVTVTDDNAQRWYRYDGYHLFWSIEPLLGPVEMWETHSTEEAMIPRLPEWVIVGAETGKQINKVIPERKWVDDIRAFCERFNIPVFYKDNLRKLFPDLPESRFPWK